MNHDIHDLDECLSSLGDSAKTGRAEEPRIGAVYHDASHLPAGCAARDCNGGTLVCWPDGTLGYFGGPRLVRTRAGVSFAPYTLTRIGLTAAECDALASP